MSSSIELTISKYEKNFQILPNIDITKSDEFLTDAKKIKYNYSTNSQNILTNKFGIKIEDYLNENSDRSALLDKQVLIDLLCILFNEIQIFTNKQLLENINEGVEWISIMLKGKYNKYQKWCLLTENLYNGPFKSPEWIGSFAWKELQYKMDKELKTLLPFCVSDVSSKLGNNTTTIKDMYIQHDVCNFIMFDDGAYSGLQKSTAIFIDTWNKLTQNIPIVSDRGFNIFIVIPYLTNKAIEAFRRVAISQNLGFNNEIINTELNYRKWEDTTRNRNVYIWGGKVIMKSTQNIIQELLNELFEQVPENVGLCNDIYNFIINDILKDYGGTVGAAMCLFEHKLPDFVSLPTVISDMYMDDHIMYSHYLKNPPYKYALRNYPDLTKEFDCFKIVATVQEDTDMPDAPPLDGGKIKNKSNAKTKTAIKTKEIITYCNKKYKVLISQRGHKYIIHNDRKKYLKSII